MTAPGEEERVRDEGWSRRVRGAVPERLGLKLTALVIALLLWFVVRVVHLVGAVP